MTKINRSASVARYRRRMLRLGAAILCLIATVGAGAETAPDNAGLGWRYDPGAGLVYRTGDTSLTPSGYAERLFDADGGGRWRRVRQGAELDLPPMAATHYRPAFVYEVDLANTDFFRTAPARRVFENLFLAVQDADDPARFRVLFGENTHVLSREDNLPSGNLPTINRSLVLEEHGSVATFGTQFGVQIRSALSPRLFTALSVQNNRGSLNQEQPRYAVGKSFAAKLGGTALTATDGTPLVKVGVGADDTRGFPARSFGLRTAIAGTQLGSVPVSGDKLTVEGDAIVLLPISGHPATIEVEALHSRFSGTGTRIAGGYMQAQLCLFDDDALGELDPFLRYDLVAADQAGVPGRAVQRSLRVGANYNLPYTRKRMNLHVEYAWSRLEGPAAIVGSPDPVGEFRLELRVNLAPYLRH